MEEKKLKEKKTKKIFKEKKEGDKGRIKRKKNLMVLRSIYFRL